MRSQSYLKLPSMRLMVLACIGTGRTVQEVKWAMRSPSSPSRKQGCSLSRNRILIPRGGGWKAKPSTLTIRFKESAPEYHKAHRSAMAVSMFRLSRILYRAWASPKKDCVLEFLYGYKMWGRCKLRQKFWVKVTRSWCIRNIAAVLKPGSLTGCTFSETRSGN